MALTLLVLANYTYEHSGLYAKDIKACDGELLYVIDSLSTKKEVIYFSESSNFTTLPNDSSKESISEIIKYYKK